MGCGVGSTKHLCPTPLVVGGVLEMYSGEKQCGDAAVAAKPAGGFVWPQQL